MSVSTDTAPDGSLRQTPNSAVETLPSGYTVLIMRPKASYSCDVRLPAASSSYATLPRELKPTLAAAVSAMFGGAAGRRNSTNRPSWSYCSIRERPSSSMRVTVRASSFHRHSFAEAKPPIAGYVAFVSRPISS